MYTTYMMEVIERLEWDLHNTIELTGRIPAEWHDIARAAPEPALEKVTLRLEADVLKFFRSMGGSYGARINDVLKSYMYARLGLADSLPDRGRVTGGGHGRGGVYVSGWWVPVQRLPASTATNREQISVTFRW